MRLVETVRPVWLGYLWLIELSFEVRLGKSRVAQAAVHVHVD